ncbi:hypothetical protein SAMN02745824_0731 [Parasphingorhabdus marina DSM 22363]|uniref:Lipoprotein n=1 Tax=Parasphingorhabdus marina DSM 22363 TaxID=1123272 RepID=A0A1N6CQU8_9SPHN|nr:hypothetical protein [Parasphingorhabdus marina]SIN60734.1 hypothetical protein SAMN02745824_0731 [Parasphingorhabdus marina DSM 22363]
MAWKTPSKDMPSGIAALMLTLLLFGCATATPYQPEIAGQRVSGGYSDTRIADDSYRVHFSGNFLTSRETVEGYLLYRAAELTLQNDKDWFRMVDHTTERDRRTYVDRRPRYRPWYGYGYWRPHWRYYRGGRWTIWHPYGGDPFWYDDIDVRTVERFEADAVIVMHDYPIDDDAERSFDARQVIADLEPRIKRPEESS